MDATDREILNLIQSNARITNVEMARKLKMAPSNVLTRLRKLEKSNVIQRYEAAINPRALNLHLTCFIFIRSKENVGSTRLGERLQSVPEVQEIHFLAGEYCYLLKVRVADTDALGELLKKLGKIEDITDTRTTLVLKTLKETACLPL